MAAKKIPRAASAGTQPGPPCRRAGELGWSHRVGNAMGWISPMAPARGMRSAPVPDSEGARGRGTVPLSLAPQSCTMPESPPPPPTSPATPCPGPPPPPGRQKEGFQPGVPQGGCRHGPSDRGTDIPCFIKPGLPHAKAGGGQERGCGRWGGFAGLGSSSDSLRPPCRGPLLFGCLKCSFLPRGVNK